MNSAIIRQLSIDLITDAHNPIIEWFNDLWSKLYVIETDVYHKEGGEFIYYMNNDEKLWIFLQDDESNLFWCNYDTYWSILESKFKFNYDDIQYLTKFLVENALNNSVATPHKLAFPSAVRVENVLNNSVATPGWRFNADCRRVENALNNSVGTPSAFRSGKLGPVENALKNIKNSE